MICAQPASAPPYSARGAVEATTAEAIAEYADQALLAELMLTPKPGLVDRRNCGAHRDMDIHTFLASARAIAPWWSRFVAIGYSSAHIAARAALPLVRPAGVQCEQASFGQRKESTRIKERFSRLAYCVSPPAVCWRVKQP
ncbi:triphosphoribosyl-dephospho-CoA synthase [Bradyrhizobium sp. 132]|uniref:triphosphoribosyl-dephospho-CoA synthase n=1 Tax=Bradyrhizobium sp. 132 TaxID=2782610 RepID=UPI001FF8CEC1